MFAQITPQCCGCSKEIHMLGEFDSDDNAIGFMAQPSGVEVRVIRGQIEAIHTSCQ